MRIVRFPVAGVLALCMLLASLGTMLMAQAPAPGAPEQAQPADAASASGDSTMPGGNGAPLTRNDLDAWLDGYMPYAIGDGDIAGAVVVVVRSVADAVAAVEAMP